LANVGRNFFETGKQFYNAIWASLVYTANDF